MVPVLRTVEPETHFSAQADMKSCSCLSMRILNAQLPSLLFRMLNGFFAADLIAFAFQLLFGRLCSEVRLSGWLFSSIFTSLCFPHLLYESVVYSFCSFTASESASDPDSAPWTVLPRCREASPLNRPLASLLVSFSVDHSSSTVLLGQKMGCLVCRSNFRAYLPPSCENPTKPCFRYQFFMSLCCCN